jgi:hypothetical protein
MPETHHANGSSQQSEQGNRKPLNSASSQDHVLPVGLRRIVMFTGIALLILLVVSIFMPNLTERVKFFTANTLNLFLLLAVAVQAYIYRRQWEVMERQGKEIERQSEQAKRHTIDTLRAYISIRTVVPDLPRQILVEIVNFGQTPAHQVQFAHRVAVRTLREGPDEFSPESFDWGILPSAPLAPTMPNEKRLLLGGIPESDMAKLHDPKYRLYFWGIIRYKDIFRTTRYTRFAAFCSLQHKTVVTCSNGNDAT